MATPVTQISFLATTEQLFQVLGDLAQAGINISAIAQIGQTVKIVTSNPTSARRIIRSIGLSPSTKTVLSLTVANVPGALFSALAPYAGDNILATYIDESLNQIVELE